MVWSEQQAEEIKTIKGRNITLQLSDADCDRLLALAGEHGLTVAELLQNFIGDLIDGTYSNGSDERMYAKDWFSRCGFGMFPEHMLLRYLLKNGYDVDDFVTAWDEQENYQEHPEEYTEEKADLGEGEKLWFEEDLEEMLDGWEIEKGREISKEVVHCREYLSECQGFKGE